MGFGSETLDRARARSLSKEDLTAPLDGFAMPRALFTMGVGRQEIAVEAWVSPRESRPSGPLPMNDGPKVALSRTRARPAARPGPVALLPRGGTP